MLRADARRPLVAATAVRNLKTIKVSIHRYYNRHAEGAHTAAAGNLAVTAARASRLHRVQTMCEGLGSGPSSVAVGIAAAAAATAAVEIAAAGIAAVGIARVCTAAVGTAAIGTAATSASVTQLLSFQLFYVPIPVVTKEIQIVTQKSG
jgi:hypothetical protein